jgi:hypothetical protein
MPARVWTLELVEERASVQREAVAMAGKGKGRAGLELSLASPHAALVALHGHRHLPTEHGDRWPMP